MKSKFAGFDPGGKGKFGWCVLTIEGKSEISKIGVVNDADAAIEAVIDELKGEIPQGVGIDAPLYWVARGDREVDQVVRKMCLLSKRIPGPKKEHLEPTKVSAVNSLQGACLVQGLLVARMCMTHWKQECVEITESALQNCANPHKQRLSG